MGIRLHSLAKEPTLSPEIARRLADPTYTRQITTADDSLLRFIREPKDHLLQTIRELSKLHRAALTLVFLHRGQMPFGAALPSLQQLILTHFSVDPESLGQAIMQLRDSFLVQTSTSGKSVWTFKHPTIADALSAILGETEGMTELYLRGTGSETIIAEAACVGVTQIPDAVMIPEALNDMLVERLAELPDEIWINRRLFSFLYERTLDQVFTKFVLTHSKALARRAILSEWCRNDPTVLARARAHSLALLDTDLREETASSLENAILDDFDTSFLDNDAILALIRPTKLVGLQARIRDRVLAELASKADAIAQSNDLDLDLDPTDHFTTLRNTLEALECLFIEDETTRDLLADAGAGIDYAVKAVEEMKEAKEDEERDKARQEREEALSWEQQAPSRPSSAISSLSFEPEAVARSIFSDVDD